MSGASANGSVTRIPAVGTRGTRKRWVLSRYGDAEDQLGYTPLLEGGEGESRAPQGFAIAPDGNLLVLDSEKMRLAWFDPGGRLKSTLQLEGLARPADVGVAADGTIAVMDHEGVQTQGTLLFSPDGKRKGMLPQSGGGAVIEMYVVGNDILGNTIGSSIKLGETSGVPAHQMPCVYNQNESIPGIVAPDGRTLIDAGVESPKEGRFFVSVLRDNPPKHLFTRQYSVPVQRRLGMPYFQADALGTIYVVLSYDRDQTTLVCLDGETGEPLGSVALPMDDAMTGAAFKQFAINREQGGLVYHHLLEGASSYEIYDCR